jgi:hypothetical protein
VGLARLAIGALGLTLILALPPEGTILGSVKMSAIQHLAVLNPYLWLLIAACIAAIAVGVRLEKRSAVALALLFGVPLELPLRANGDARLLLSRRARREPTSRTARSRSNAR